MADAGDARSGSPAHLAARRRTLPRGGRRPLPLTTPLAYPTAVVRPCGGSLRSPSTADRNVRPAVLVLDTEGRTLESAPQKGRRWASPRGSSSCPVGLAAGQTSSITAWRPSGAQARRAASHWTAAVPPGSRAHTGYNPTTRRSRRSTSLGPWSDDEYSKGDLVPARSARDSDRAGRLVHGLGVYLQPRTAVQGSSAHRRDALHRLRGGPTPRGQAESASKRPAGAVHRAFGRTALKWNSREAVGFKGPRGYHRRSKPEWRNGRRRGLKIPRSQGHEGSTPSSGTK